LRKGLYLTDRDIDMFVYLAYGPAFEDDLNIRFFISEGKKVLRKVFLRRLKKLIEYKYIECYWPPRALVRNKQRQGICILAAAGIKQINYESLVPHSRVRHVKLDTRTIFHEVMLTRLIRKIYDGEPRRYQVTRMEDHFDLAKLIQRARMKRIPDLKFTVQLINGSYFSFIVEIDAGTTHMPEFMQKLQTFMTLLPALTPKGVKEPVGMLVVCHTAARMAELQKAVMESHVMTRIKFNFLFNTIYGIDNHLGLFNPWYRADGQKIEVIFRKGQG